MKTSCPACGATASLDVLLGNEGAREAVMAALAMPAPIGKLLIELLPLIAEAKIERNGRIWSAPQDYWRMALEEMLAKRGNLTLPLKNHGYLLTIIAGYSSKAESIQEAQSENTRAGRTPVGSVAARQPVAPAQPEQKRTPIPDSVKAELGRLKTKTHP